MMTQVTPQVTPEIHALLQVLAGKELGRAELQAILLLKDRKHFREKYLNPAIALGLVDMLFPQTPSSPVQKYFLSAKGKKALSEN